MIESNARPWMRDDGPTFHMPQMETADGRVLLHLEHESTRHQNKYDSDQRNGTSLAKPFLAAGLPQQQEHQGYQQTHPRRPAPGGDQDDGCRKYRHNGEIVLNFGGQRLLPP